MQKFLFAALIAFAATTAPALAFGPRDLPMQDTATGFGPKEMPPIDGPGL